ncbi:MAG TPA: tRNA (adenosine(37)-N6)-threonylcarbamoyltransferase complex transferase subunit TsaD [Lentisphaeria bacterium]|nr:MAG: tRNA (adenosine(37)-N6)-threonylcarbamoyltransferase complex transferase subunit TsaD [Lentisphaerae bacterium GWF2_38_69]HBM16227.1 tRNA (adenosine(37)-N6)-threonylcarbamoyltransferase complex transferase subunit TsaD [Lentisphaeria bacterium]
MYILGIETSCDETSVSIVKDGYLVLSNVISSQISKHAVYGGVVPELAAREHLTALIPVTNQAFKEADISLKDIEALAVTNGPGLIPALLVGLSFAKGICTEHKLPLLGVNHFIAHIYAAFLNESNKLLANADSYPVMALVVSGGHTALVLIDKDKTAKIIGTTIDDAAGEALDKGAKILNLGYPGGPVIDKLSESGNRNAYHFPRSLTGGAGKPLAEENIFNFSFSGLKTALLYHIDKIKLENFKEHTLLDTVASYQYAVIDVLCIKTIRACRKFKCSSVVLCGGVAQNSLLRTELESRIPKNVKFILTPKEFCGDNAAMIAGLGFHYLNCKEKDIEIDAFSRLPEITQIPFVPDI